jgi:hypothetical protein
MEDRDDVTEQMRRCLDALQQIVGFDVIGELERDEVLPLGIFIEEVSYENVFQASAIELPYQRAADESSATSHQDSSFRKIGHGF